MVDSSLQREQRALLETVTINDCTPSHAAAFLKTDLADKITNREIYMKGVDASYHYEGCYVFNRAAKRSAISPRS